MYEGNCGKCNRKFSTSDPFTICNKCPEKERVLLHSRCCTVAIDNIVTLCWKCYRNLVNWNHNNGKLNLYQKFEIISYFFTLEKTSYAIQQNGKYYLVKTNSRFSNNALITADSNLKQRLLSHKSFFCKKIFKVSNDYLVVVRKYLFNIGLYSTKIIVRQDTIEKVVKFANKLLVYKEVKSKPPTKLIKIRDNNNNNNNKKKKGNNNNSYRRKKKKKVFKNISFIPDNRKYHTSVKISIKKSKKLFSNYSDSIYLTGNTDKLSLTLYRGIKVDRSRFWYKSDNSSNANEACKKIKFCLKCSTLTNESFKEITGIPIGLIDKKVYNRLSLMGIIIPTNLYIAKEVMLVTGKFFRGHKDFGCGGHGKTDVNGYENLVVVFNLVVYGKKIFMLNTDKQGHCIRVEQPIQINCVNGTLIVMIGECLDSYWHSVNFEPVPGKGFYVTIQYRIPCNKLLLKNFRPNKRNRNETDLNVVESPSKKIKLSG